MRKRVVWRVLLTGLLLIGMLIPSILPAAAAGGALTYSGEAPDLLYDAYSSETDKLMSMQKLYEAYGYELYVQLYSGEVAVRDQKTGQILFTNPYDIGDQDIAATQKQEVLSQILLRYKDTTNEYTMNSYADCVLNDQLKVYRIRGGVRVQYTIGETSKRKLAPRQISKDRFEEMILEPIRNETLDDKAEFIVTKLTNFYQLKDPNDNRLTGRAVDDMLKAYPYCAVEPIYVLTTDVTSGELSNIQTWLQTYTKYTMEDMQKDHNQTGYVMQDDSPPVFKMSLEYYLTEDGFTVRMPARGISFDSSLYKLVDLDVLPYFGAGLSTQEGYTFIPDGSGAIVKFKDVADSTTTISGNFYGSDFAFHSASVSTMAQWRFPVYGVVRSLDGADGQTPQGYVAIMTEGDSLAKLTSYHGGSLHPYHSTYLTVYPRQVDSYPLDGIITVSGSSATYEVDTPRKYVGNFTIQYRFLWEDQANYVGMAKAYRSYLEATGVLTRLNAAEDPDIPLYINSFGDIDTTAYILGVPVAAKTALTTFSQMQTMISLLKGKVRSEADAEAVSVIFPDAFKERELTVESAQETLDEYLNGRSIDRLVMEFSRWYNGGMRALPPSTLNVEGPLGGDKGLKELSAFANEQDVELYLNLDYMVVDKTGWFDGFSYGTDAVKTVEGKTAHAKNYSSIKQQSVTLTGGLISASAIEGFYQGISKKYEGFGTGTVALSELGYSLNSDHNEDAPLNREESKALLEEFFAARKASGQKVLTEVGNAYLWDYADHILNVQLDSSARLATSEDIPFIGIVLHGYLDFAGKSVNLAGDYKYSLLKAVENGASPYFVLSYENTSDLKAAGYSTYYSIEFPIWFDDLIETYEILNTTLKQVRGSLIENHEIVMDRVVEVTYDNGVKFLLNYNNYEITYGDFTVEALSFVVE